MSYDVIQAQVAGESKLPSRKGGHVAARQSDRRGGRLIEGDGLSDVALAQEHRADDGGCFEVERTNDAGTLQLDRSRRGVVAKPCPTEQFDQQSCPDLSASTPGRSLGWIIKLGAAGSKICEGACRSVAEKRPFSCAQVPAIKDRYWAEGHGGAPGKWSAVRWRVNCAAFADKGGFIDVVDGGGPASGVSDGHAEHFTVRADAAASCLSFLLDAVRADVVGGGDDLLADPYLGDPAGRPW